MIEILVTLVIIATALLGTAGLQLYAMKVGKNSEFRTQAIFLASDLAERMEANKAAAVAGKYEVDETDPPRPAPTDCGTVACDEDALAAWDISQWKNAIIEKLPQAKWSVTQTQTIPGKLSTYRIIIKWVDRSMDKTGHGTTFSYTATRTVAN